MSEAATQQQPWASKLFGFMQKGWESTQNEELVVETRDRYELKHTDVDVVYKDHGDIIFQFFPRSPLWPPQDHGRGFLAEVIEAHFGGTDHFSASYVPELESWGVRAEGLANILSYDVDFHVVEFVRLVDNTVDALR